MFIIFISLIAAASSYYFFKEHKQTKKLITDENHISKINIINAFYENEKEFKDIEGLTKLLEHVLLDVALDATFNIKSDDEKIYVKYTLNNDIFYICIKSLKLLKKKENYVFKKIPKKIIIANLLSDSNQVHEVTSIVKMFQGPEYNFYSHLEGVCYNINSILFFLHLEHPEIKLKDFTRTKLHIFDLYNDHSIYETSDDIIWY